MRYSKIHAIHLPISLLSVVHQAHCSPGTLVLAHQPHWKTVDSCVLPNLFSSVVLALFNTCNLGIFEQMKWECGMKSHLYDNYVVALERLVN